MTLVYHVVCLALCVPVATLVHVMEGFGSPSASHVSLAVLSAGNDTTLMCGSAILGLDRETEGCQKYFLKKKQIITSKERTKSAIRLIYVCCYKRLHIRDYYDPRLYINHWQEPNVLICICLPIQSK